MQIDKMPKLVVETEQASEDDKVLKRYVANKEMEMAHSTSYL